MGFLIFLQKSCVLPRICGRSPVKSAHTKHHQATKLQNPEPEGNKEVQEDRCATAGELYSQLSQPKTYRFGFRY